jgi:hypothetical protein
VPLRAESGLERRQIPAELKTAAAGVIIRDGLEDMHTSCVAALPIHTRADGIGEAVFRRQDDHVAGGRGVGAIGPARPVVTCAARSMRR